VSIGEIFEQVAFIVGALVALGLGVAALASVHVRLRRGAWRPQRPVAPPCPRCGGTGRVRTAEGQEWPCLDSSYHDWTSGRNRPDDATA
jgi:hypothetical protein